MGFTITVDATFVALVALIVFVGLMIYLRVPGQVGGMLDKRSQEIAKELSEARRLREEAERFLAEQQDKKLAAEAEAEKIVAAAKDQAFALMGEARVAMKDAAARRQKQAEERIALAEAQASTAVRAAAVDAAIRAAEQALRAGLDDKGQSALVAEGVAQMGGKFG